MTRFGITKKPGNVVPTQRKLISEHVTVRPRMPTPRSTTATGVPRTRGLIRKSSTNTLVNSAHPYALRPVSPILPQGLISRALMTRREAANTATARAEYRTICLASHSKRALAPTAASLMASRQGERKVQVKLQQQ